MSLNFSQIGTLTVELAALECLKNIPKSYSGKLMSPCQLVPWYYKDIFKSFKRFDIWHVQTVDLRVTKALKNNCSLIGKIFKIF